MFLDSQLQFSDDQALTATAVSTNIVPLDAVQQIGIGEPIAAVITVGVALAGTSPTLQVDLETDDDSGFGSATTVTGSGTFTALAVGDKIVLPLGFSNEQYLRLNYTLGGTAPTVTVDAYLTPLSMIDGNVVYPDGYDIQ